MKYSIHTYLDLTQNDALFKEARLLYEVAKVPRGPKGDVKTLTPKEKLEAKGHAVRVVSMPSWELFDAQPRKYRDAVLPPEVKVRLAVEAGVTRGWAEYVGQDGSVVGLDRFGASAPGDVVMEKLGFTADNVTVKALELLKRTQKTHK